MGVMVAGSAGMVGSAICRALERNGTSFVPISRSEADLTQRAEVDQLLDDWRPDSLVIAAAKVGGIHANDAYPADFIYDNLMIETNLIESAFRHGIDRVLFLGSSCIYPREATQPMKESELLKGPLELTNEPYAIAKITGIKLCESYNRQHGTDYRSLMPTNLYGPGDNFHPENSHVIPGLLRRFHEAKVRGDCEVTVWGSGRPRREFLHVDDLASAVLHILGLDRATFWQGRDRRCSHVNVGTGTDHTIAELAEHLKAVIGLEASLAYDASQPDGTPRKLLDISQISELGWAPQIGLARGLEETYAWFLANEASARG